MGLLRDGELRMSNERVSFRAELEREGLHGSLGVYRLWAETACVVLALLDLEQAFERESPDVVAGELEGYIRWHYRV